MVPRSFEALSWAEGDQEHPLIKTKRRLVSDASLNPANIMSFPSRPWHDTRPSKSWLAVWAKDTAEGIHAAFLWVGEGGSETDAHRADFKWVQGKELVTSGIRPQLHIHVASKAPWFTISDNLPQLPDGLRIWLCRVP
jgi:hypothetical protein